MTIQNLNIFKMLKHAAETTAKEMKNERDDTEEVVEEIDSADEALCEMLGISFSSFQEVDAAQPIEEDNSSEEYDEDCSTMKDLQKQRTRIQNELMKSKVKQDFMVDGVCIFPKSLSLQSSRIRRLCDELVWSNAQSNSSQNSLCTSNEQSNSTFFPDSAGCDRTYETINKFDKERNIVPKRELTRLENFVNHHRGWHELCHGYLKECASCIMGESGIDTSSNDNNINSKEEKKEDEDILEMTLFKEKLNLKPSGGSGFAPHLDSPSLRIPFGKTGPSTFITVMVAIDNMTSKNGCLRVVEASSMNNGNIQKAWSEHHHVPIVEPKADGNPDTDGRAGAILTVSDPKANVDLPFKDIICESGDIVIFNGWVPHHSKSNQSHFARRAVFLTYNPFVEGDFHDAYYEKMNQLRQSYKERRRQNEMMRNEMQKNEHKFEMDALNTIPRI